MSKIAVIPAYVIVSKLALISRNSDLRKDGINIKRNAMIKVVKLTATILRDISIPIPIRPMALKHVKGKTNSKETQMEISGM